MPIKLVTPVELVKKDAVLIDTYKTTQIIVSLSGNPYITVKYAAFDADGKFIGTAEAILNSDEVLAFIANNPAFYDAVKNKSYQIGKMKGVIPNDAGVI